MNFSVLNKIQQQAEEIKDIIDQIKALEEGLNYLNYPKHLFEYEALFHLHNQVN